MNEIAIKKHKWIVGTPLFSRHIYVRMIYYYLFEAWMIIKKREINANSSLFHWMPYENCTFELNVTSYTLRPKIICFLFGAHFFLSKISYVGSGRRVLIAYHSTGVFRCWFSLKHYYIMISSQCDLRDLRCLHTKIKINATNTHLNGNSFNVGLLIFI